MNFFIFKKYFFAIVISGLLWLLNLKELFAQNICERIVPQDTTGYYDANIYVEGNLCSYWPGESGVYDSRPNYHVATSYQFNDVYEIQPSDGKNVLRLKYAIVYDDNEEGAGGMWAKWTMWVFPNSDLALDDFAWLHSDICMKENWHPRDAHITCLYGRYAADDTNFTKCEWYDTDTIPAQSLTYKDFVIWDWDWYRSYYGGEGPWDTVYIYFYENDETFLNCDDPIMLFEVKLRDTIGQLVELSPIADYDGEDIDVRIWVQTEWGEEVNFAEELIPGQTQVKTSHVNELRSYISSLRQLVKLSQYNWGESLNQYTTVIKAVHINELRTAIAGVYQAIGRSINWSESIEQGKTVKAEHIDELRRAVLAFK